MELFQKAITVKLSHRDKYLMAEDDKESVCQDRNGSSKNAIWAVEFVNGENYLCFKSCYGKYLTASNAPFLPGTTGRKVLQTVPTKMDSSIKWEPIRDGFSARFRTPYGHFLRANGGLPPWRNSVTHDTPRRMGGQEKILWDIEIVEALPSTPSPSCRTPSASEDDDMLFRAERTPPTLREPKFKRVKN
ncbi:uncharacterized protein LOC127803662 [Diospyros lotus]|uniref:uncharacterized protein LOC127803662 n=1 Tax=Diospyros lotus TaxID=55363 RepID=UPI00224F2A0E|nr:uncharacterized protein LOC127803662 [Diospyros lotus]